MQMIDTIPVPAFHFYQEIGIETEFVLYCDGRTDLTGLSDPVGVQPSGRGFQTQKETCPGGLIVPGTGQTGNG
jgi:hypothetical protein